MSHPAARPYVEPGIVPLLSLSSFLFLSNVLDFVLNRLLYCGLVGQILLGVAWGTPGGNLLSENVQDAMTQFGYIGLILIVYEGGLATDLRALRSNLFLSLMVAMVGVSLPVALSFTLQGLLGISALQAFAAGASLCSTSLGTTFTVLTASGLGESRLGVVLTSAAMMDDVVGLIMSAVISSLGTSTATFSTVTVIRPVFVSLAYAVLLPLICTYMIKPLTLYFQDRLRATKDGRFVRGLRYEGTVVMIYTSLLFGFVTSANYAGTSELFSAYLAGVISTWWDRLLLQSTESATSDAHLFAQQPVDDRKSTIAVASGNLSPAVAGDISRTENVEPERMTARLMYERYFQPATDYILRPFFFASIGFAIPISRMFSGSVVWRGVVYSILMIIAKLACGLCLVRFAWPAPPSQWTKMLHPVPHLQSFWAFATHKKKSFAQQSERGSTAENTSDAIQRPDDADGKGASPVAQSATPPPKARIPRPRSLYPAALLGGAMVARGEIGFLISSIAETDSIFSDGSSSSSGTSESFLVTTWAILICTILGPIFVGTLVGRVRRLQTEERRKRTGKGDPLGLWGIQSSH